MAGSNILGGKNPENARSLLAAGEITQAEYKKIMDAKGKGKRMKSKSIFDVVKEAITGDKED